MPQLLASWNAMNWLKLVGFRYSSSMGLGEVLVLVQEAQVQGHAIQQVTPGERVERAARPVQLHRPGAPASMASSWSARGTCSSMVRLHTLRPYLSCSCKAAKVHTDQAAIAAVAPAVTGMGHWSQAAFHLLLPLEAAEGLPCPVLVCLH